MTVRVVTAPVYEPITRAQAKLWAKVDSDISADDFLIDILVKSMREYAENLTGRSFVQRTLQYVTSEVPVICVDGRSFVGWFLPYPPLVSVTSITYIDTDGTQQTLTASDYNVHTWHEPGFVVQDWEATFPSFRAEPDAWRINYLAGYAPGSPQDEAGHQDVLPAALKVWMQARMAGLYAMREQFTEGHIIQEIPRSHADGLLDDLVVGHRMF